MAPKRKKPGASMTEHQRQVALAIGERVRIRRTRKTWSQEALAHAAGLSYVTVSRIENGWRIPDWFTIEKLAAAFGCHMMDLMPLTLEERARIGYFSQKATDLVIRALERRGGSPIRAQTA